MTSRAFLAGIFAVSAMLSSCAARHDTASAPAPPPAPAESSIPADIPAAGTHGYTKPMCSYCPGPQYSREAFDAKIQGTVVMDVVIGADGRAHQIVVKKSLGHGLDEQAIRAVQAMQFKPALGPDGNPATVHMLIEVTFHLY
jgi:TonB family protein